MQNSLLLNLYVILLKNWELCPTFELKTSTSRSNKIISPHKCRDIVEQGISFWRPFFFLFPLIDWRANWVYQHYLLFLPILLIILLPLEIFFLWVFSSCVGWIWLYCDFLLKIISHFSFENTLSFDGVVNKLSLSM